MPIRSMPLSGGLRPLELDCFIEVLNSLIVLPLHKERLSPARMRTRALLDSSLAGRLKYTCAILNNPRYIR